MPLLDVIRQRIPAIPWPTLTRAIFLSHTRPRPPCGSLNFHYLLSKWTHPLPRCPPSSWFKLFLSQTLSHMDTPIILKFSNSLPTCRLRRWNRQCSETSAYKIHTPGNYPKENIQQWTINYLLYKEM